MLKNFPLKKSLKLVNKKMLIFGAGVFLLLVFTILKIAFSNKGFPDDSVIQTSSYLTEEKGSKNSESVNDSAKGSPPEAKSHLLKTFLQEKIQSARNSNFKESKRNIFINTQEKGTRIEPPKEEKKEESEPEVILPPINLKFLGIIMQKDPKSREIVNYAILSEDEEIFIVKKGDIIESRYEILSVEEGSVEIKDTQMNRNEIIHLEE